MRFFAFWRALLFPCAAAGLLLLASPAAGEDETLPRREASVEGKTADGEAPADQATEPKLDCRAQPRQCDAARRGGSSSPVLNAADWQFDWINIRPELIVDSSCGEEAACHEDPARKVQVLGAEGRLLLTFELGEGRGDFVLDATAQEIQAAAACPGECRCPHCGTAMRFDFAPQVCPPLQDGEAAKEIMEIRRQVNPALGLPSWEYLQGPAGSENGRDVLIRKIRAHEADDARSAELCDEEEHCELKIEYSIIPTRPSAELCDEADRHEAVCSDECPSERVVDCPVDCPTEWTAAARTVAVRPAPATTCPEGYCVPGLGYAGVPYSPSYVPAMPAGYAPHPQPVPAPHASWTGYAVPSPDHAERQAVQMLRDSGHQLDCTAHALESQGHYEQADLLREMACELREQAREAQYALEHPAPPLPHSGAEYSEAGLRDEIRQLRQELRQGRERPSAPLGIER